MSNKFNPFNNPKPAIYFIAGFIALAVVFLSCEAKAETQIEWGPTFASTNYSNGSALFFSEVFGEGKYLVGLGLIGDQSGDFNEGTITIKSYMLVHAQRLVTYKKVTLGLGIANWQHTNRMLGDEFTFSLSLSYRLGEHLDVRYRHFSNGGTATPNSGQDILLIGYRF